MDLVRAVTGGGDYEFKHALVREALYESLLSARRAELHLRVAEEIERRSGNRLVELAEELAHHYSQTDRSAKTFAYLAMAGEKSLGVYSLDEAERCFSAAVALADRQAECATDEQIVETLISGSVRNFVRGAIIAPMEGEYGDQEGHAGRSFGWPRPEGCVFEGRAFR